MLDRKEIFCVLLLLVMMVIVVVVYHTSEKAIAQATAPYPYNTYPYPYQNPYQYPFANTAAAPDTIPPPDTQITSAIDGTGKPVQNGGTTSSNTITFTHRGTDNTGGGSFVSNFQCSIDNRPYSACGSQTTLPGLTVGGHGFAVAAVDSRGNIDRSPALFTWTVTEAQQSSSTSSSSLQLSSSQSATNTNPASAQGPSLAPEKTIAQSQITKGSNQSPALAATTTTTTTATCSASVCVNPGETAYLNVICFNPVPQAVGTCIMLSGPPGATFSSTTGNPAFGTMTWTNAGPPGTYQASFQAICLSAPPGFTCSDSNIFTLTVFVNSPPVANAGPDQTVNSSDTVTLQGSGTDADNDPLTYTWTQTAGPSVSLSSTNVQNPTFIAPKLDRRSQTLSFQLVVNDGRIDSKPDDVNIIVKPSSSNPGGGQDKCDPAKIAEITQKFQTLISRAQLIGWDVAADNLDLFLKGTGGIVDNSGNIQPKVMDVTWLRDFSVVTDEEQFNQQRFETSLNNFARTLNDGETKSFPVTLSNLRFTANPFTELFFASGTSTIQSSGTFELTRSGNTVTVTGTVDHHWFDQYVWATGKSTRIPGSGVIPDSDALLLQDCSGAKPFDMKADWSQSLTGTINKFLPNSFQWTGP